MEDDDDNHSFSSKKSSGKKHTKSMGNRKGSKASNTLNTRKGSISSAGKQLDKNSRQNSKAILKQTAKVVKNIGTVTRIPVEERTSSAPSAHTTSSPRPLTGTTDVIATDNAINVHSSTTNRYDNINNEEDRDSLNAMNDDERRLMRNVSTAPSGTIILFIYLFYYFFDIIYRDII